MNKGRQHAYRCGGRYLTAGQGCDAPLKKADALETLVWDAVTSVIRHPERKCALLGG